MDDLGENSSQLSGLNLNHINEAFASTNNYHQIIYSYSGKITTYNHKLYIFDTFIDFSTCNYMGMIKTMRCDQNKRLLTRLKTGSKENDINFNELTISVNLFKEIFNTFFQKVIEKVKSDSPIQTSIFIEFFCICKVLFSPERTKETASYNDTILFLGKEIDEILAVNLFSKSRNSETWIDFATETFLLNILLNTMNFIDVNTSNDSEFYRMRKKMKSISDVLSDTCHRNLMIMNHASIDITAKNIKKLAMNFKVITTLFYLFGKFCNLKNCYNGLTYLVVSNYYNKLSYLETYKNDSLKILIADLIKANLLLSSRFIKLPLSFPPVLNNPLILAYDKAHPSAPMDDASIKNAETLSKNMQVVNNIECFKNSNIYAMGVINILKIAYPDEYIDYFTPSNSMNTELPYTLQNVNNLIEFRGAHVFMYSYETGAYCYIHIINRQATVHIQSGKIDNNMFDMVNRNFNRYYDSINVNEIDINMDNNIDVLCLLVLYCIIKLKYCNESILTDNKFIPVSQQLKKDINRFLTTASSIVFEKTIFKDSTSIEIKYKLNPPIFSNNNLNLLLRQHSSFVNIQNKLSAIKASNNIMVMSILNDSLVDVDSLQKRTISFGLDENFTESYDFSNLFDDIRNNIKYAKEVYKFSQYLTELCINERLKTNQDYSANEIKTMFNPITIKPMEVENNNIIVNVNPYQNGHADIYKNLSDYFNTLKLDNSKNRENTITFPSNGSVDHLKEHFLNRALLKGAIYQILTLPDKLKKSDKNSPLFCLLIDDKSDYYFCPLTFPVRRPVIKENGQSTIFYNLLSICSNNNENIVATPLFASLCEYIISEFDLTEHICISIKNRKTYVYPIISYLSNTYTDNESVAIFRKLNHVGILHVLETIHSLLQVYMEVFTIAISYKNMNSNTKIAGNVIDLIKTSPDKDKIIKDIIENIKFTILFYYMLLFDHENPTVISTIENTLHYVFCTQKSQKNSTTIPDEHKEIILHKHGGDDMGYNTSIMEKDLILKQKDILSMLNAHHSMVDSNTGQRLNNFISKDFVNINNNTIENGNITASGIAIQKDSLTKIAIETISLRFLPVVKTISLYNLEFEKVNSDIYHYYKIYSESTQKTNIDENSIFCVLYFAFVEYIHSINRKDQTYITDFTQRLHTLDDYSNNDAFQKDFQIFFNVCLKRATGASESSSANTQSKDVPLYPEMLKLLKVKALSSLRETNIDLEYFQIKDIIYANVLRGSSIKKYLHGVQTIAVLPVHAFILKKIATELSTSQLYPNVQGQINVTYFSDYNYLIEGEYKNFILLKKHKLVKGIKTNGASFYIFLNLNYFPALPVFKKEQIYFTPTVYTQNDSFKLLIIIEDAKGKKKNHILCRHDITTLGKTKLGNEKVVKLYSKDPDVYKNIMSGMIPNTRYNKIVNTSMKDFLFTDIKLLNTFYGLLQNINTEKDIDTIRKYIMDYLNKIPKTIHKWKSEDLNYDRILLSKYLKMDHFTEHLSCNFNNTGNVPQGNSMPGISFRGNAPKDNKDCINLTRYSDSHFGMSSEYILMLFDYEGEHYSKQIVESLFSCNEFFTLLQKFVPAQTNAQMKKTNEKNKPKTF